MEEKSLAGLIGELQIDNAMEKVKQMLADHRSTQDIYQEVIEGLAIVGKHYNEGKCFIADLIVSGTLAQDIFSLIMDDQFAKGKQIEGTIVIGTIVGDIHDIGKDLICNGLRFAGVDVIDLGVDVSVERFVAAVKKHHPDLLGISTIIDSSFGHIKSLIDHLQQEELIGDMKIVVGGSIADPRYIHLDHVSCVTNNYKDGIQFCLQVLENKGTEGEQK